jgi:hypothetical protein
MARASKPLGVRPVTGRFRIGRFSPRMSQVVEAPGVVGIGGVGKGNCSVSHWGDTRPLERLRPEDELRRASAREALCARCPLEERDLSLKWVSRCCFMLSARVNFFWQPAKVHWTAFSAV